jgi:ribosomal protein S18 acetylase RimI-like enzyme
VSTVALRAPEQADAGALAALLARVAPGPTETSAELADDLRALPTTDAWLLEEGGDLVGYAAVRTRGALIADADLAALPGREQTLVELVERRARELGTPVLRVVPRAPGAALAPLGYRLERTFLRLGAPLDALAAPEERPVPLEAVAPTDPALHQLDQLGFAGSWGFVAETYAQWRTRIERRPAAPSFVARAAGQPVGGIRCTYRYGWGWVCSLVVAPAARGRGIGAQLLAAAAEGLEGTHVGLEVDEVNAPARRLYDAAGLRELDRERFFEKVLH